VRRRHRDILERAVAVVADQAAAASAIVDEAHAAGLDGSHAVTIQAKMLRLELLNVKADLERELGRPQRTLVCPDPSASLYECVRGSRAPRAQQPSTSTTNAVLIPHAGGGGWA
jgi:hypothetical protein